MKTLRLTLAGDIDELSPNKRPWTADGTRAWMRKKKAWRAKADAIAGQLPRGWWAERVRITFTVRRARALDNDNAAGSDALKMIVDALKGRCFPGDEADHVEYGSISQEAGARYRFFPELEVLVEEIE